MTMFQDQVWIADTTNHVTIWSQNGAQQSSFSFSNGNATAMAAVGSDVWMALSTGVYRFSSGGTQGTRVTTGVVSAMAIVNGEVWMAEPSLVSRWTTSGTLLGTVSTGGAHVVAIAVAGSSVWMQIDGTLDNLAAYDFNGAFLNNIDTNHANISALATIGDTVWAAEPTLISLWDFDGNASGTVSTNNAKAAALQAVPEPATWALCGLAIAGALFLRRHHTIGRTSP